MLSTGTENAKPRDAVVKCTTSPAGSRQVRAFVIVAGMVMVLVLAAGCGDAGVPLECLIEEGEAERVVLATRIAEATKKRDELAKELGRQSQSNQVLRAEVLGLHGRLEERELRLSERDDMLQAANNDLKDTQQRLADMKATSGGQSNLIERAKAYTTGLKHELAAREREVREKDRLIDKYRAELAAREHLISELRSRKDAPPERRKGLVGPIGADGRDTTRKVRRLGE
jgi:DNA repair exonuclease SbcCD ATPase subunit